MRNDLTLWDDDLDLFTPILHDLFNVPKFKEDRAMSKLMRTDIKESEKGYTLDVEMPGVEKKDINLELKNGYLTIGYSKDEQTKQDENGFIKRERHYGSASRSFFVGKDIKQEDISASLNNGLLNIFIPKKAPQVEQSTKIEIK